MSVMFVWFLMLLLAVKQSISDIHTSTAQAQQSQKAAFDLINGLSEYIEDEELRLARLESHLRTLQELDENWIESCKGIARNVHRGISGFDSSEKFDNLYMMTQFLPKPEDMPGIIVSIAGLQNTYNISSAQLASGHLQGYKFGSLSAEACFDIGIQLATLQYFRLSLDWVDTAHYLALHCVDTTSRGECFKQQLIDEIVETRPRINEDFERLKSKTYSQLDEMIENGAPASSLEQTDLWKHLRKTKSIQYFGPEAFKNYPILQQYENLCIKRDTRRGGFCTERRNKEMGYSEIPRRVELISKYPLVIMLHDVVDDRYINFLTNDKNVLSRSFVLESADTTESAHRTSKTFWLDDYEAKTTSRVNSILEEQTGFRLNRDSTEKLQVVNYGIGGQYRPHYDYLPNTSPGMNRLATMLIYLSDVELGGSTVFPALDIAVAPVKGSVLIFVNLDEWGRGLQSTFHGGCPVVVGCKWIANKWVRLNGQDLKFTNIHPSAWTDVL